ncbi:hypothetical protein PHLCEN_2v1981 [Hermanssonia centrifuga]|uniref:Uncharacterized protein n=1 Tax=Hermanssonia centrifuga TaxID=98765 RepID=A0A2R6RVC8_9APHY|nr:hypothetical protein PHLCEN_2v1981 [Hermanssonia centrifuga]
MEVTGIFCSSLLCGVPSAREVWIPRRCDCSDCSALVLSSSIIAPLQSQNVSQDLGEWCRTFREIGRKTME